MTVQPLNEFMEFDRVIQISVDGTAHEPYAPGLHAPEVVVECAEDDAGSITFEAEAEMVRYVESQGWELMTGYSGQYLTKRTDAIMHVSEYVGGRLEQDIRAKPGLYVAVEVTGLYATEEQENEQGGDPIGWVVARKVDQS